MSKIVIFGEGKIAEVVYFHLKNDSPHEIVAFTVDKEYYSKKMLFNLPIVPFEEVEKIYPPNDYKMIIAVGYQSLNQLRATKYYEAKEKGYELISYICSTANNFGDIEIGDNCLILDNATLNPMSKVGNNVFIWSGNHIGHHSTVGDHCYLSGHVIIGGHTTIGPYCFIGINATIGHEVTIGEKNLIGAGTLITKNTTSNSVYITQDTQKFRLDSSSFIKLTRL